MRLLAVSRFPIQYCRFICCGQSKEGSDEHPNLLVLIWSKHKLQTFISWPTISTNKAVILGLGKHKSPGKKFPLKSILNQPLLLNTLKKSLASTTDHSTHYKYKRQPLKRTLPAVRCLLKFWHSEISSCQGPSYNDICTLVITLQFTLLT